MAKTPKEHCAFVDSDGKRCGAYPVKGMEYCFGHARQRGLIEAQERGALVSPVVQVDEPEALKALRQMEVQLELGGGIDEVAATQLANILRPYLGRPMMDGIEIAQVIDKRLAADEQVAKSQAAKINLIDRSHGLINEHPSEQEVARVEAKVARDIEEAASTYRAKMEMMKAQLRNEPREGVYGTGEDEIYMVNGVKIVIPAGGQFLVPKTIAGLHRERQRQRREKKARSDLMQSVPEYSQVYRGMAEIDRQYGSHSQLGGGPSQEQDDFLVAEEIK